MADELDYQKVLAKLIFQNPDDAAVSALNKISEPHYEMGGVVYKGKDGYFGYSEPQGDQRTGKFRAEARIPKSSTPVGIYHTHPGYGDEKDLAEMFSADDVDVASKMKMLSYIRALNSGNIKKFEPGVTPVNTQGIGLRKTKDATGSLIYAKTE
jgi:hypothetical protein